MSPNRHDACNVCGARRVWHHRDVPGSALCKRHVEQWDDSPERVRMEGISDAHRREADASRRVCVVDFVSRVRLEEQRDAERRRA